VGLAENAVFAALAEPLRERLVARSTLRTFAAGERILSDGDPGTSIYVLERGRVRVFHASPAGAEVALKIFRAPAIFGEAEALAGFRYGENVSAVEPSDVRLLPVEAVLEAARADGAFATALLQDVARRFAITIQLQKSTAFDPVTTRLANFLLSYAADANDRGADPLRLDLTQDEMAAATAASRRSVAEDIINWQKEGILERRGRYYAIRDVAGLKRYCDPAYLGIVYSVGEPVVRAAERLPPEKKKR
jgi:CRP-like cAMP-binding protein